MHLSSFAAKNRPGLHADHQSANNEYRGKLNIPRVPAVSKSDVLDIRSNKLVFDAFALLISHARKTPGIECFGVLKVLLVHVRRNS